jgi:DNA-binding CsgD family transcriptional regulator
MRRKKRERLVSSLTTLDVDDPEAVRESVVEALCEEVPADFGMHIRFTHDDYLRYSFPAFVGQPEPVEAITQHEGQRAYNVPWFPPNADPGEVDTFISPRSAYGDAVYFSTEAHEKVYGPLSVVDELRALLWDGHTFLGWIGIVRRGDGNRFTRDERELLASVVPEVKTSLASAASLESRLLGQELAAVYKPDGSLDHASRPFIDWLDDDRRDYLRARVRQMDRHDRGSGSERVSGAQIRLLRLDAGFEAADSVRYMVTVGRPELWTLRPEHRLTDRQLEVAEFAKVGATAREIADTLGISNNTVKQHLKNIYRRLGIGSRAELASLLSN